MTLESKKTLIGTVPNMSALDCQWKYEASILPEANIVVGKVGKAEIGKEKKIRIMLLPS